MAIISGSEIILYRSGCMLPRDGAQLAHSTSFCNKTTLIGSCVNRRTLRRIRMASSTSIYAPYQRWDKETSEATKIGGSHLCLQHNVTQLMLFESRLSNLAQRPELYNNPSRRNSPACKDRTTSSGYASPGSTELLFLSAEYCNRKGQPRRPG